MLELDSDNSGAAWLGLEIDDGELIDTLMRFQDLGYVSFELKRSGGGVTLLNLEITGRGLQVIGEWPRFEAWSSPVTLAAFAERMTEFASPDDRTRLQRAAEYLRSQGAVTIKSAAIAAASQVVRGTLGPS